jgi:hypothetical protein
LILRTEIEYQKLDSLIGELKALNKNTHDLINERINLLNMHRAADMKLTTFPVLKIVSSSIDSLTNLIDGNKKGLDKTENEYDKQRQFAIRIVNSGVSLITKEYMKIQTGISVPAPFSKDSLSNTLLARNATFNNILVNLYTHNEAIYRATISNCQFSSKLVKVESKIIRKTMVTRDMAYDYRIKHENTRYKAFHNLISNMLMAVSRISKAKT